MLVAGFWLSFSMLLSDDLGKGTKAGIPRETGATQVVLSTRARATSRHTDPSPLPGLPV